jgi:uncharacterized protein
MLLVGAPSMTVAASFDCDRAATETEIAICSDPELSALDELMGQAYQSANVSATWMTPQELQNTQVDWLHERNRCGDNSDCLRASYVQRLDELSTGVRILNVTNNFTSFIYEGEPVSGACRNGTELSNWGQCVTWIRGGPSFRAVSVEGAMAFNFEYLGINGHMCGLAGRADKVNGLWLYQNQSDSCALRIELGADGIALNPTPECDGYCGSRAQGRMEYIIEY